MVAVLFEGGEHGKLAARLTAQIVKAYVEKQRRLRNNPMLFSDKADPGSVPIAGVWNQPDSIAQRQVSRNDAVHARVSQARKPEQSENQCTAAQLLVRVGRTQMRKPARPLSSGRREQTDAAADLFS